MREPTRARLRAAPPETARRTEPTRKPRIPIVQRVSEKISSAALNIDPVHIPFNLRQVAGAEYEDKSHL